LLTPTARHLVAVCLGDPLPDLRIVTREVALPWFAKRTEKATSNGAMSSASLHLHLKAPTEEDSVS